MSSWLLSAAVASIAALQQTPAPVVAQTTVDGVTIQVVEARWMARAEAERNRVGSMMGAGDHGLVLGVRASASDPTFKPAVSLRWSVDSRNQRRIVSGGLSASTFTMTLTPGETERWFVADLDPREPRLRLALEWPVKNARPAAIAGSRQQTVTFHDVPIPPDDKPVSIERTETTDSGIEVTLGRIAIQRTNKNQASIRFTTRWMPTEKNPAPRASLAVDEKDVIDDTGKDVTGVPRGSSSMDELMDAAPGQIPRSSGMTWNFWTPPAPNAKTLDITVRVNEEMPRDERLIRSATLDVPLTAPPKPSTPAPVVPAVATATARSFTGTIASLTQIYKDDFTAELLLRSNDARDFALTQVKLDGDENRWIDLGDGDRFWHPDGTPFGPGEGGTKLRFSWFGARPATRQTVSVRATVQPVRREHFELRFGGIGPGALGGSASPTGSDARLTLRSIDAIDRKNPPEGWKTDDFDRMHLLRGTVIAFEFVPPPADAARENVRTGLDAVTLTDANGRAIPIVQTSTSQRGDSTSTSWTIVTGPVESLDGLSLTARIDRVVPVGRPETLLFRDVALPEMKPGAKP